MQRPTRVPEYLELVERYRTMAYGEVLPHAIVADLVRQSYGSSRYYDAVRRAIARTARDYGIEIVVVRGVGYRRVEPEAHGAVAHDRLRQARRRIAVSARVMRNGLAVADALSAAQRDAYVAVAAKIAVLSAAAREAIRACRPAALPPATWPQHGAGLAPRIAHDRTSA